MPEAKKFHTRKMRARAGFINIEFIPKPKVLTVGEYNQTILIIYFHLN